MDYITIGEIINVRGIRGEIKVKPLTSDVSRFNKLRVVYVDEKPYKILGLYIEKGFVYLSMSDIRSRNDAELLKGKFLMIDQVNAIDLDEGEYFIKDLIGMTVVFEDGEVLGKIENINQFGAADVFTVVTCDGKKILFPFLKRIVSRADINNNQFVLIKERFDEVAVYED